MTGEEFYKTIAKLDRGVADRWKDATGGNLGSEIGAKTLVTIFKPLFETHYITPNQAHAIDWFFTDVKMNDAAKALLAEAVFASYDFDYFFQASKERLLTASELGKFNAALGAGFIGNIKFQSPGTGLSYVPDLYNAIRLLVTKAHVRVYEVDAARLMGRAGTYRSDINRLVLYKGFDDSIAQAIVVHEVTHAIQDWRDIVSMVKYTEADAFVAQAVAKINTGAKYFLEFPEQEKAARLVIAGKAMAGSAEWVAAYDSLVKAIATNWQYRNVANSAFDAKEKDSDEKKILEEVIQTIKQNPTPSSPARGPVKVLP